MTSDPSKGNTFFDVEYPLPESIRTGAASRVLTVKFAAEPGSTAGGVFDVRLLK